MAKRTLADIDIEIEETELEILDLKKSIHDDEPDWREAHRLKTRDIGIGYVPLAERRKRVTVLEGKVPSPEGSHGLAGKTESSGGKKFGHGELKKRVQDLAGQGGLHGWENGPVHRGRKMASGDRERRVRRHRGLHPSGALDPRILEGGS